MLRNKADNPIRIDWNQVTFVDESSESHKVMHTEDRFEERHKYRVPTVVPPTAKVEDYISPLVQKPLFPEGLEAKKFKGHSFSIFMPLEINGVVKNYLFTFKIMDVII